MVTPFRLCAFLALAALPLSLAAAPAYRIIDLGRLGGSTSSSVLGIDSAGHVTGLLTQPTLATFRFADGAVQTVDTKGLYAFSSGPSGAIAGVYNSNDGNAHLFAHAAYFDGTLHDAATNERARAFSTGTCVNGSGMVGGIVNSNLNDAQGNPLEHAALFANGAVTDLGVLDQAGNSQGEKINAQGHVAGNSDAGGNTNHAFLWKDGVMHDLQEVLGPGQSFISALNDLDQVAVVVLTSSDAYGALITGSQVKKLGHFSPEALNNAGEIVGSANEHAAVYLNGLVEDLNKLVQPGQMDDFAALDEATGVNEAGFIVGVGTTVSQHQQAFLAIPFQPPTGTFDGVASVAGTPAGYVKIAIKDGGGFTANLQTPGVSYSFTNKFSGDTFGGTIKISKTVSLAVDLLHDEGTNRVTGSISDGTMTYDLEARLLARFSKKTPAAEAGSYTAILPPPAGAGLPQGQGWAKLKVDPFGVVTVQGRLNDNTVLSHVAHLHADGSFMLYQRLYAAKTPGAILGEVTFEPTSSADAAGTLTWQKPTQLKPQGAYADGFSGVVSFQGAQFIAPALAAGSFSLVLEGGDLAGHTISHVIGFDKHGALVVQDPGADRLRLSLSQKTGTYTGTFLVPGERTATSFSGVIYQHSGGPSGGLFPGQQSVGTVAFPH